MKEKEAQGWTGFLQKWLGKERKSGRDERARECLGNLRQGSEVREQREGQAERSKREA